METRVATVKLHRTGFEYAKQLINERKFVHDDRDQWSEHQPSAEDENKFIEEHGWAEYGKWHLAVDTGARLNTKGHYKFPYGDFQKLHRCAVLAAEVRAGQRKYGDIEAAAAHLHGQIDEASS
jgi:hypothetical protein